MATQEEKWETVTEEKTTTRICVDYGLKGANVFLPRVNAYDKIKAFFQKLFTKEELKEHEVEVRDGLQAQMTVHYLTQVCASPPKVRLVIGKEQSAESCTKELWYSSGHKKKEWDDESQFSGVRYWRYETLVVAKKLGWERAVFADSEGKPTRKPVFVVREEGGELYIEAPVAQMTDANFRATFKVGKKAAPPS